MSIILSPSTFQAFLRQEKELLARHALPSLEKLSAVSNRELWQLVLSVFPDELRWVAEGAERMTFDHVRKAVYRGLRASRNVLKREIAAIREAAPTQPPTAGLEEGKAQRRRWTRDAVVEVIGRAAGSRDPKLSLAPGAVVSLEQRSTPLGRELYHAYQAVVGSKSVAELPDWRAALAAAGQDPDLIYRRSSTAGLEERFEVPAEGIVADGYTTADGKVVPNEMIASGLVAPGERRLLVPVAPLQAGLRLHVQRGLLDGELLARLRSLGVQVDQFMLSDIPEVDPRENNVFVAAVQHDSDLEKRMRGYGAVLVNLYGSAQGARPHTPVALATLIRAARQFDGLLRLEGVTVDEYSGVASLDLAA